MMNKKIKESVPERIFTAFNYTFLFALISVCIM